MVVLPHINDWATWGSVFCDAAIWSPIVSDICQKHNLPVGGVIESGFPGTHAVFIVGNNWVVKIYAPLGPSDYKAELGIYREMADTGYQFAPKLIASGSYREASGNPPWQYIITEYISGVPLREVSESIDDADAEEIAFEAGCAVRRLHSIAGDGERVQLHGDLTDDHIILTRDEEGWKFKLFIDFGDGFLGNPAYDLVSYWFNGIWMDRRILEFFIRGYGEDSGLHRLYSRDTDEFRNLVLTQTLEHRFSRNLINDFCERTGRDNRELMGEPRDVLGKILWF